MVRERLEIAVLRLFKAAGLFHLSRFLMRRRLLILCFHGFELVDESAFRPKLFMHDTVLQRRLAALKKYGYAVLRLDEALRRLQDGTLPDNAVCITIDDGFYSVLSKAAPLLKQYEMPATLYLTTYYVIRPVPIFRLAVQYLMWKTSATVLDVSDFAWGPKHPVDLANPGALEQATWHVISYGETRCGEEERQAICHALGERLGVDYAQVVDSRALSLVTTEEMKRLEQWNIDVQLHTHRHRLRDDDEVEARRELHENRDVVVRVLGSDPTHLCYPSGEWNIRQWPWLSAEKVQSATTCEPGFNTAQTPAFGLYRLLDEHDLPQIRFEAELFGLRELMRMASGRRRQTDSRRGL